MLLFSSGAPGTGVVNSPLTWCRLVDPRSTVTCERSITRGPAHVDLHIPSLRPSTSGVSSQLHNLTSTDGKHNGGPKSVSRPGRGVQGRRNYRHSLRGRHP